MTAIELKEYLKPRVFLQCHLYTNMFVKCFFSQVSHFKVPRYVRFVDDYPRTVTGKVRKVELKKIAAKEDFSKDQYSYFKIKNIINFICYKNYKN